MLSRARIVGVGGFKPPIRTNQDYIEHLDGPRA